MHTYTILTPSLGSRPPSSGILTSPHLSPQPGAGIVPRRLPRPMPERLLVQLSSVVLAVAVLTLFTYRQHQEGVQQRAFHVSLAKVWGPVLSSIAFPTQLLAFFHFARFPFAFHVQIHFLL